MILGRGFTLGRPLAMLLSQKRPTANAAVTVVHTGVPDWPRYTQRADIVVAAAGVPGNPAARAHPARIRGRGRGRALRRPAACSPTSTNRARRSRAGSRRGSAASARRLLRCCFETPSKPQSGGRHRRVRLMSAPAEPLSARSARSAAAESRPTPSVARCGLARPAARGPQVLGRSGLWMLGGVMLAVYAVVLLIVAAARLTCARARQSLIHTRSGPSVVNPLRSATSRSSPVS